MVLRSSYSYVSFKKYNFIIFEINILCWLYLSFWFKWMNNCTSSDLLTKKETARELRSSIPALQAEKSIMVNGPTSSHRKYRGHSLIQEGNF